MKVTALALAALATFASAEKPVGPGPIKPEAPETIQCGHTLAAGQVTELQESLICENDKGEPALIMSEGSILKVKEGAEIALYGRSGKSTEPTLNAPLEEFKEADVFETPAILIPKEVTMAKVEGLEIKGFEYGIFVEGATELEIKDVKMEQLKKIGLLVKKPMDAPELEIEEFKKTVTILDTKMEAIGVKAIDIEKVHVELNLIRTQISNIGQLAETEEVAAAIKLSPLQPQDAKTVHILEDVKISAIEGTGILLDLPEYKPAQMIAPAIDKFPEVDLFIQGLTKIDFTEKQAIEIGKPLEEPSKKEEMSERIKLEVAAGDKLEITASALGFNLEKAKLKLGAEAVCKICENGPIWPLLLLTLAPLMFDFKIPLKASPSQFEIDPTATLYFDDVDKIFSQEKEIKDTLKLCKPMLETTVLVKDPEL